MTKDELDKQMVEKKLGKLNEASKSLLLGTHERYMITNRPDYYKDLIDAGLMKEARSTAENGSIIVPKKNETLLILTRFGILAYKKHKEELDKIKKTDAAKCPF